MLLLNQGNYIKNTIHGFLPGAKVLLFGSRVRGEETAGSDIDLLGITEELLNPRSKTEYEKKIRQQLTQLFAQPLRQLIF